LEFRLCLVIGFLETDSLGYVSPQFVSARSLISGGTERVRNTSCGNSIDSAFDRSCQPDGCSFCDDCLPRRAWYRPDGPDQLSHPGDSLTNSISTAFCCCWFHEWAAFSSSVWTILMFEHYCYVSSCARVILIHVISGTLVHGIVSPQRRLAAYTPCP